MEFQFEMNKIPDSYKCIKLVLAFLIRKIEYIFVLKVLQQVNDAFVFWFFYQVFDS